MTLVFSISSLFSLIIYSIILFDVDTLENMEIETEEIVVKPAIDIKIPRSKRPSKEYIALNSIKASEQYNTSQNYIRALRTAESFSTRNILSAQVSHRWTTSTYTEDESKFAIDNIDINWEENALWTAQQYASSGNYPSRSYIKMNLKYDGYTEYEINYALDNVDVDWNNQALGWAIYQYNKLHFTVVEIYENLVNEDGYSVSEANYSIERLKNEIAKALDNEIIETKTTDEKIKEELTEYLEKTDEKMGAIYPDSESEKYVAIDMRVKNDENIVNLHIKKVIEILNKYSYDEPVKVYAYDVGNKVGHMTSITIDKDRNTKVVFESGKYNTEYQKWLKNQFSSWDGSHRVLTKLVKNNLHDEKSYKHIETTYLPIENQNDIDYWNGIIGDNSIKIKDVIIFKKFSAKNAFGGTTKNQGIGIIYYKKNEIKLLGIISL